MPIPESQLETWSHQGSVRQSRDTYATIKRALEASDSEFAGRDFKVFLQGSYGNDTNIYAESDVDVVIRLDSLYYYDTSALTPEGLAAFNANFIPAPYTYTEYKRHVIAALEKSFGARAVKADPKAIKIDAQGNRRSADVVPAAEFRRYHSYSIYSTQGFEKGICFFNKSGDRVVNYPKQHSENCTAKHQATRSLFKPMVRILKNLRNKLIDDGCLDEGAASSYFLEGLLYNVPNEKFGGSYQDTMLAAVNWILSADRSKFVCANRQYYLLGDSSAVQMVGC
jgi:hypothetical protein